ncbi:MAG: hypothetical protein QXL17_05890 [Candidatus Thermoplasmatota archaeon]
MKVTVGNDEFCPNCMDWKEYDDEGRCKVCKKLIKKKQQTNKYEEYKIEDSTFESDEESNSSES